jgi:hypothetical protein
MMDIEKRLSAEHSKTLTSAIVNFIGSDKKRFRVLMDIFLGHEYRLIQRAAWPLSYVALEQPQLIKPYFKKLIQKLEEPGNHPAIPRNILRIFQETGVPEQHQAKLLDICFRMIPTEAIPVAVRAYAITTASHICSKYPELKKELDLMLHELSQIPQPAALKQRIKLALKQSKIFTSKV